MKTHVTTLAVAVTVALSGCSMLGGDDEAGSSSSESSGVVNGDTSKNGAKEAGIDLKNPPKAIGETTLRAIDSENVDTTTVELLELRRDDNVMLATFRLTGDGRGTEMASAYDLLGESSFEPVFVDMKNMEKYRNVDDLTSDSVYTEAPLGEPVYMFTAFPLPREGVDTMDLQVQSARPEIVDVPMPR